MALVHLDTNGQSERVVDAIRATVADTQEDLTDMAADEAMTRRALELLGSRRNDAYEAALAAVREDTQAWWADTLACDPDELGEGEEPATADVEGPRCFLEGKVLPWFEHRHWPTGPLIREQAFGEAMPWGDLGDVDYVSGQRLRGRDRSCQGLASERKLGGIFFRGKIVCANICCFK